MADSLRLDETLRTIQDAAREFDAGQHAAASAIASGLIAIVHSTPEAPSLLSQHNATYTRVASSVGKSPHPQDAYAPLTEILIDLVVHQPQVVMVAEGAASPGGGMRFQPYLDRLRNLRQVQAPDWWRSESVFVMDHSRLTRRDVVLWVAAGASGADFDARFARLNEALMRRRAAQTGTPLYYGHDFSLAARGPCFAALRQMAHEILNSPELLALAGRGKK